MKKRIMLGLCISLCLGNSAYAQISSNAASLQLSSAAKQKVLKGGINLQSLLTNNSNDLIVEYEAVDSGYKNAQELRQYYAQRKQQLMQNFKRTGGFELLRDYNALPVSFHRIKNRDTLVQLLNDPNVKGVYPNRISSAITAQSYDLIGQPAVAAKGFKGDGTTVAVLDTGANYRNSDFGNCTAPNTPSTCRVTHSVEIAPEDYSLDDYTGHGSNVAGIVSKVAPNAKLVALDVFRGDYAYDSDIISALNWVANNAATLNIKSANLSIGDGRRYTSTCTNSALTNSFNNLRKVGVIPVVAAGNEAYTNGISYPACTAGAVSVGAVYDSNIGSARYANCSDSSTYSDKVTCFSNSSSNLTLLAPGAQMTAGGYTQSGTSQASPHVAGAIAVLRASNAMASETLDETVERLKATGTLVTDHRNSIRTPRINLLAAVNGINNPPTQPPVVTPPTQPPVVTPPTQPPVVTPPTQPPVVTPPTWPPVVTPPIQPPAKTCYRFLLVTICF